MDRFLVLQVYVVTFVFLCVLCSTGSCYENDGGNNVILIGKEKNFFDKLMFPYVPPDDSAVDYE